MSLDLGSGADRPLPPEAWPAALRLVRIARRPLEIFVRIEASSGIVLVVAAALALAWANSPWADSYDALWELPIAIHIGGFHAEHSLRWLVDDGLMTVFFFVVGMEIRREIHQGELSQWRRATLPVAAAVGGMVTPALLYLLVAGQPPLRDGWGIPMATDIAFALGILALLGRRVPGPLRVMLLGLAVIDDLGAIVVIALFYSQGLALEGLATAFGGLTLIFVLQRLGVRAVSAYAVPSILAWVGAHEAGIHPTIAGVAVGMMIPVRAWLRSDHFVAHTKDLLERFGSAATTPDRAHEQAGLLRAIDDTRREAISPADRMIDLLHPWVAFAVMPVFALANAGMSLRGFQFDPESLRISAGVCLGLALGKPVGILLACALVLRTGLASLPRGMGYRHLLLLGLVAGIGFTMAIFIAQLAFRHPERLAAAKLGILASSVLVAAAALGGGRFLLRHHPEPAPQENR